MQKLPTQEISICSALYIWTEMGLTNNHPFFSRYLIIEMSTGKKNLLAKLTQWAPFQLITSFLSGTILQLFNNVFPCKVLCFILNLLKVY